MKNNREDIIKALDAEIYHWIDGSDEYSYIMKSIIIVKFHLKIIYLGIEEAMEYLKDETVEELADIIEVVYALAKARGYYVEELHEIRRRKLEERGGFEKRLLLAEVTVNDSDMGHANNGGAQGCTQGCERRGFTASNIIIDEAAEYSQRHNSDLPESRRPWWP